MSRTRRNFSSKFKSDLVLEVLKGEKDLNSIAVENDIQPNLLRNWKREFLEKASVVFDDTREDNLREKLSEERKEKEAYGLGETFDYLDIGLVSIMFQMLWDIVGCEIFKG